ncbi:hypothetical protein ABK040_010859 [Willaertia magna]
MQKSFTSLSSSKKLLSSGLLKQFSSKQVRFYATNTSRDKLRIGFIGLGQMGARMAPNLLRENPNEYDVFAYDVTSSNINLVTEKAPNVKGCKSIEEIMETNPDCVITMLPTTKIVSDVYKEIISLKKKYGASSDVKTIAIDSSTVDPQTVQNVQLLINQENLSQKLSIMDAPVSGGVNGAANGTLTFMVGTDNMKDYEFAQNILKKMGKSIVLCGNKVGMGQVAKLCNNLVLATSMAGVSEALVLGTTLGMDPKVLSQIFGTSTAQCWSVSAYNPFPGVMENVPSSRDYEGGFAVNLMCKDLGLVNSAAKNIGYNLEIGKFMEQLYQETGKHGLGNKDFGSILKYFQETNTKPSQ